MAWSDERLNRGCTRTLDDRHSECVWEDFIRKFDPIMSTACGRLWRRGSCPPSRNPDGTSFRGAWWGLPCGVYVCVGPERGHFYAYDPVRDVAVPLNSGWTQKRLEGVLGSIVEHAERGE